MITFQAVHYQGKEEAETYMALLAFSYQRCIFLLGVQITLPFFISP